MIKYEDECVGCPPEMGCLGAACPNRNVERHVCDECGSEATCTLDGEELCDDCLNERLDNLWNEMRSEEKADLLEVILRWLD